MLIKRSTMLFRDKHCCLFLFCLVVCYPRAPCQSPYLELLSTLIDIFKTAALQTGSWANTGSWFQFPIPCNQMLSMHWLLHLDCWGVPTTPFEQVPRCYADHSTLKGLLTIFVSIAQISYFSNGVWYSWFWSDAKCPKLKHFRFQFCPQGFWLAALN